METSELNGKEGLALLGRRDGGFLEVLAFETGQGKALCLFETQELANAFARVNPDIHGQGWSVHVMTNERLPELVEEFDYVALNPSALRGSEKELLTATGFARSMRRENEYGLH